MKKVAYITNSQPNSGVGYRAENIKEKLKEKYEITEYNLDGVVGVLKKNGEEVSRINEWPGVLGRKTINWIRLGRHLSKELKDYDLVHLTNQSLSFLVNSGVPSVVTVHDLIEMIEPQTGLMKFVSGYLYKGISSADYIISVSEYTKKTIRKYFGVSTNKIAISYNAVGKEFYQIDDFEQSVGYKELVRELKMNGDEKIVLYVGSEHPRKNLVVSLRAFARMQREIDNVVFIKVGEAGLNSGREETLSEIDRLGIRDNVKLVGSVSNERLNQLYNLADVLIYPSKFEGFGLPPLQAMSCGTPVITSNSTSLPEVVGEAALVHDPNNVEAFADSLKEILRNRELAQEFAKRGLVQAEKFSWSVSADKVSKVYDNLL